MHGLTQTNRIGETKINNFGSLMTIVEYNKASDITVKFEGTEVYVKSQYGGFKSGYIKNPYDPTVYGHGYIGEGKYIAGKPGNLTRVYATWKGVLQRCYDPKFQARQPEYKKCTIVEEWLNFQVFGKWYDQNYYEIEGQTMSLDKDILVKNNKIYGPNTAIFVPRIINNLFISHKPQRGILPVGVYQNKKNNKYIARCSGVNNRDNLGSFLTSEEAFQKYKEVKEKHINEIAEEYKDRIPKRLYDAMCTYKIEITD